MEAADRSVALINELRGLLSKAESAVTAYGAQAETVRRIEAILVGIRQYSAMAVTASGADIAHAAGKAEAQLTGPWDYKPGPYYEKCSQCHHYRIP